MRRTTALLLTTLTTLAACKRADDAPKPAPTPVVDTGPGVAKRPLPKPAEPARMYTTYFYTAAEAVVHGYEDGTKVRIVALGDAASQRKGGTIWEGVVGTGETKTVPTGAGVFGFLSDKKAAILAGTPSSCAVVGYFVKDQEGRYRSNRFFTQLPSSAALGSERMVVWAYEPAEVTIRNPKTQEVLASKTLAAGGRLELDHDVIKKLGNQVLEIVSSQSTVAVQVYYDQGFIVPSSNGRGAGKDFLTFVGALTAGSNDLDVIALDQDAKVTITDVETGKALFTGPVKARGIKTLSLANRYVRVQSDSDVQVVVAAFETLGSGYAEHHFATGREGGGIDNDFSVTTSGGLWMFSYFADNAVTVTNMAGVEIYKGTLQTGMGHEIAPGVGLFRVRSSKGLSVMGGASSCGADYSPAAGMFAVDEAMLQVIQQVTQRRIEEAKSRGVDLEPAAAAAAPISAEEWDRYGTPAKSKGYSKMSLDEANQRAATLKAK
ncbi:MAG: hypothetical protein H0T89_09180 [Deltaproteobacteria bacterium]|nr:hypothetical protein [Deltaproteobacteria bacterium]MDQ3299758.1 hypothetical protein [Myxococcota bacterium]